MPKRWFLCWVVNEFILGGGLVVFGCDFITSQAAGGGVSSTTSLRTWL